MTIGENKILSIVEIELNNREYHRIKKTIAGMTDDELIQYRRKLLTKIQYPNKEKLLRE